MPGSTPVQRMIAALAAATASAVAVGCSPNEPVAAPPISDVSPSTAAPQTTTPLPTTPASPSTTAPPGLAACDPYGPSEITEEFSCRLTLTDATQIEIGWAPGASSSTAVLTVTFDDGQTTVSPEAPIGMLPEP